MHFIKNPVMTVFPALKIENRDVNFKRELKFLGMIFDPKLIWKNHINGLKRKAYDRLIIIKVLVNRDLQNRQP